MTLKQLFKVLPHYQKFIIMKSCKNPYDVTPKYIDLEEIEHYKIISIVAQKDIIRIEVK